MIDPNKVTEAVSEFLKNPGWKDIFMNAPGGAMERLAISFYFSKFHDSFKPEDFQEYRELRDEYEKSMTEEDLQYLIDNSDKDTAIKHYQELLDKIKGGEQPTGTLRFEKEEKQEETEGGEEQTETTEAATAATEETRDGDEQTSTEKVVESQEQPQSEEQNQTEENTESKDSETTFESDEGDGKPDEKYDTALSVALNYLQNEKKKQ